MEIYLAEHMGMCRGLRLILHRTNREITSPRKDDIYLFRELVHNNQAHEYLLELGVKAQLFDPDDIPNNTRVIVGPHSAPPSVLTQISQRATLVDTSCKFVLKVLEVARALSNEGYRVVFIGMANHEEAEMIQGALPGSLLVSTELDVDKLPRDEPLGLVSQSTQTLERFMKLARFIEASGRIVKIGMTVCQETQNRQISVTALAKQVNKMIVIGGKHSNNTLALTETAQKFVPTWQIETATELKNEWFEADDRVGITAGASTPDVIVNSVVKRLQEINLEISSQKKTRFALDANKLRWLLIRIRTLFVNITLSLVEWIQHIRGRNPTGA
jgi:4-hydroxy-3-methylbut-2-enyl diphosphate reductase